jgi:hypothetical protein
MWAAFYCWESDQATRSANGDRPDATRRPATPTEACRELDKLFHIHQ